MLDFSRTREPLRHLPLTPMIDVVFILIIFFMLTSSFMKVESMEISLPSPAKNVKVSDKNLTQIFLLNDGTIQYGQRPVDKQDLRRTLNALFAGTPDHRVLIMSADKVALQTMVEVMDVVYMAGGKNVFVREWQQGPAPLPSVDVPYIPAK